MLRGKTALITGSISGLGYAMAEALAQQNANIILHGLEPLKQAQEASERLESMYEVSVIHTQANLTKVSEIEALIHQAQKRFGSIDILINNAGGGSGSGACHLLERDPEDVGRLIATNLTGALHCCQAAARIMIPQKSGKIISISSMAALMGRDLSLIHI